VAGDGGGRNENLAVPLAYLLLAMSVLISVFSQDSFGRPWQTRAVLLGTGAVTLLWIWWWTTAHPGWRTHARRMRVYYVGRSLLALALSLINPFCAIFAFVGYLDMGVFERRGRQLALVATALIAAGAQSGGLPPRGVAQFVLFVALLGINAGLASAMVRVNERQERLMVERAATIAQLEEANARLADALAENVALHRQLLVQAREAGVLDERQRLAREIHDTIAQGLAGVITQLQAADESVDPVGARDHRARAAALARVSLEEARRSVRDLAPRELDHDNLPAALDRLVCQWSRSSGVTARVEVTGDWRALHEEVESTLLRVGQESLANVGKHADARLVVVTLSAMDDVVTLDVRDDGRGFAPEAVGAPGKAGGFGLSGMRHRAQRLAGELAVESAPGGGTAVSVRLPALAPDNGARPAIPAARQRVQQ
jgi:signal transduction histidine kinase